MILDSLRNAALYRPLGERIAAGLAWLEGLDPSLPDGRYAIEGDELFATVQSYDTAPGTEKRFESHRRFLDVQYLISGRERILHAPVDGLEVVEPYREESDVLFYADPAASSSILVRPGEFCILHPHDAHKPGCMAGGRDAVKKVVVKVLL